MSENSKVQILVFDVGGSHIAGGILDLETMSLGRVSRIPAPASGGPEQFFQSIELLGKQLLPATALLGGLALAFPGPFDYELGISYMKHKYEQLYGADIRRALADGFACDPVKIHFLSDSAGFLLGEAYRGAAAGVSRAIGITLGTGMGSAFSINGEIVTEGPGVPADGEIWNQPYRGGIVEDVISSRAIQQIYRRLTGASVEVSEIARLVPENILARQTFAAFGKELGTVLGETCAAFRPERIVLGGAISRSAALFLPAAQAELALPSIELRVSALFDNAPLIGAAIGWVQRQNRQKVLEKSAMESVTDVAQETLSSGNSPA